MSLDGLVALCEAALLAIQWQMPISKMARLCTNWQLGLLLLKCVRSTKVAVAKPNLCGVKYFAAIDRCRVFVWSHAARGG